MNKQKQLYLLLGLFFGPLLVAWIWFFHFQDLRPGTTNKGDLVEPVVALADIKLQPRGEDEAITPFAEHWNIVMLATGRCDSECERALHYTRQVWIRLNKDAHRVQRVLIAGPDVSYPVAEHPDLHVYDSDAGVLSRFDSSESAALDGEKRIYLVDPYGNVMMSYPLDFTPEMLNDDLKRLLRYSDAA